ncbi:hypothetical protein ABG067_003596 [Albugo candida]
MVSYAFTVLVLGQITFGVMAHIKATYIPGTCLEKSKETIAFQNNCIRRSQPLNEDCNQVIQIQKILMEYYRASSFHGKHFVELASFSHKKIAKFVSPLFTEYNPERKNQTHYLTAVMKSFAVAEEDLAKDVFTQCWNPDNVFALFSFFVLDMQDLSLM